MKKYWCVLLAAAMPLLAAQAVAKQMLTYPTRNIEVIIPKNPGGGTDTSARTLLEYAKDRLPKGIIFVPVNKPAGNGVTGLIEVAKAKPDGYKLVMTTVELAMFPYQHKSPVTYKDFTPLVTTIADPVAIVVKADSSYKTMKDFIQAAKQHPGKLMVGNSGMGAIYDLATVNIENNTHTKFNHIPYNEGTGPSIAALVGGHLDAVLTTPGAVKSQVDAGILRVLAVMDDKRFALFPDVPTIKEALNLNFNVKMRAWAVLATTAKLPPKIESQLVKTFTEVVNEPAYKEALRKQGIMPVTIVGQDAADMMKEDDAMYKQLIAETMKK
ncbi:tripartite tricarboxylate transporter substrate binding protein [Pectobacteriaceae bacterium CE70]|uniref:Tripartite tricarboxylate transporter substrate binding protein n=1 Tax=Serratia sp. (strain ATCC 39006) TaxID=104623 RepID=A0A2I5TF62_SERS3|nr:MULTISPECIES: tripartite tricarboxylate transporter substrate binding protein [Enterobacterales]WJV58203.1 tripartite tricarboxylate transporter substrate binding protein [Pectobacteriaceae bacterium C111]WJV66806.1 tripartite tricarboxylate transporter substrate binding protein [Pectobacteriaceae bacterium CE70]WJY10800.1 tripartite tricarboxylate transporter substrate binding protein [Pectobacteriaceae bacterium C80]AUG98881.1 tripartite tricarboxylate transporter substrate binding protein